MSSNPFNTYRIQILFVCCLLFHSPEVISKDIQFLSTYKIAFGSCLDQNLSRDIWIPILKAKPDLWIWLGDNIYKDTADMSEKKSAYDLQKSNEHYLQLKKKTKILGIWDDHDYGINDVGNEYPMKKESKELFLDFLDTPESSPIRHHEGIYSSEKIKYDGIYIKIIMLDTRTFRTELKVNPVPNLAGKEYIGNEDPDATILGKEQWTWLEKELKDKADLVILISSIQVLNDTHRYEKWSNFPLERKKLLTLLDTYTKGKSILLSGDRHIAEIFEETLPSGKLITDITSSSMNKPIPARSVEIEDSRRKSQIYSQENFGILEIKREKNNVIIKSSIQGKTEGAFERSYQIPIENAKNQKKKRKLIQK